MVGAIAEFEIDDTIGANLAHSGQPAGLEVFAQSADEDRGCARSRAGEARKLAMKPGVNEELLALAWFCELEEKDALVRVSSLILFIHV